jgi:hypothetical protein
VWITLWKNKLGKARNSQEYFVSLGRGGRVIRFITEPDKKKTWIYGINFVSLYYNKSIFMRVTNKRLGMKFDCVKLMNWAQDLLGPSKCTAIAFTWDAEEESCGWYNWDETIWINLASCKRMITVQKTILHEWTHAQQRFRWYNHYNLKLGYKKNPYEIQARENEKLVKRAYKKRK